MPFLNDVVKRPSEIRAAIEQLAEARRSWERRSADLPKLIREAEDAERMVRGQVRALRAEQSRLRALPKDSIRIDETGSVVESVDEQWVTRYHQLDREIVELEQRYTDWVNASEAQRVGGDKFGHQILWSTRRVADLREQQTVAVLCHAACSRAIDAAERDLSEALRDR